MSGAHVTTAADRLAGVARLLMQLRFLLTAVALLLLPADRSSLSAVLVLVLYAMLSGILGRYWRRLTPYLLRAPWLVGADIFIAAGILAVDGPSGAFFVATVLTSAIAGVLFAWRRVAAVAGLQMLGYTIALVSHLTLPAAPVEGIGLQLFVIHPLLYPVAGFMGIRLRLIFMELAAEQELRRAAERAAAAAEERARLARDMHDSVAKTLRGAAMAAQALPLWLRKDPERAAATAAQVAKAAEIAAREARELIADLRDDSAAIPLAEAVGTVLREWSEETGIRVTYDRPDCDLPLLVAARLETVAILREALTNIRRHAAAHAVAVSLGPAGPAPDGPGGERLLLRIADDGTGFVLRTRTEGADGVSEVISPPGHYGLIGMAERARCAGGTLTVDSAPGAGTRITLQVPLAQASPSPERTHSDPHARPRPADRARGGRQHRRARRPDLAAGDGRRHRGDR
ncbi:sensor histidine kinase [Marinitenerispora sediminis]|uniref:sensor histidine kinase n=1 Tax=Marinitenerispora sediminis TaxID=1931232 RepID=UPI0018F17F0F|nr:histidine kinase [Marinitenerispora sediminis]